MTTQTTKYPATNQAMIFEVELRGVGMDFSMGIVIDDVRNRLKGIECLATRGISVRCNQISLEKVE